MEKIIILDFEGGEVFILDYDSDKYSEPEDFFAEQDRVRINQCEYMIVKADELNIKFSL